MVVFLSRPIAFTITPLVPLLRMTAARCSRFGKMRNWSFCLFSVMLAGRQASLADPLVAVEFVLADGFGNQVMGVPCLEFIDDVLSHSEGVDSHRQFLDSTLDP